MPPPVRAAVLPLTVESMSVSELPVTLKMPPPPPPVVPTSVWWLSLTVESMSVTEPSVSFMMPPPQRTVVLPLTVERVSVVETTPGC